MAEDQSKGDMQLIFYGYSSNPCSLHLLQYNIIGRINVKYHSENEVEASTKADDLCKCIHNGILHDMIRMRMTEWQPVQRP